ncbi:MAG TPA: hypothetical protein PKY82_15065 [Pyrinomonadaceae bacterium]|nr:hypothetical protein [Pyrinomonadaceae bacterium]
MNKRESDDSPEQHISDGGGGSSVYHKTTNNLPEEFSGVEIIRDPDDALTISSLLRAVWILLAVLTVSFGLNVFLAVRKADRIVVDKTSGRVVELNNRDYGATESVEIAPDRPNDTDKKYLVKEFLKSLYEVEQSTRESEVNKLLRMLDADLSLSLATRFKQNGILAAEKAESVNSSWELQDLSVDERDPYILRAIGVRRIRRKAGGQDVEETLQLKCKFLLKDSPQSPARNDNNLRTGFTILRFRVEPVSGKTSSPIALLADGDVSGTEIESPNTTEK